jgi:hypothetical protein
MTSRGTATEVSWPPLAGPDDRGPGVPATAPARLRSWLPAVVVAAAALAVLLASDTALSDIARYAWYVGYAVLVPGTLVYRALRRTAHTLLEDLGYGFAVGLALELGAWALWSAAGLQRWLWLWPALVLCTFLAVPGLRRHWWVRGYRPVGAGFGWALAAIATFFLGYLYLVFLHPTAITPHSADQQVYIDLPFQLSIAADTKFHFPPHVPQVAEEPLHYHWFGFAHMGTASLISGVDLPVVFYRLDVPLLCLVAIAAIAVTGWRVAGKPAVGLVAAALTFVIGEFNFTNPVTMPFGTLATFIVWGSPSMTYSWVLLIPLVGVLVEALRPDPAAVPGAGGDPVRIRPAVPPIGPGVWVAITLLAFASSGAKASSVPVALGAVAAVALFRLLRRRGRDGSPAVRLDRRLLAALGILATAQVFATVVVFAGESHGTRWYPFWGMIRYYPAGGGAVAVAGIAIAYLANMLLRLAGLPVLVRQRRRMLGDVEAYLVGGLLAGVGAYLLIGHPGDSNQYFTRAGWIFGVIASAWAWVNLAERLPARWRGLLAAAAGTYVGALVLAQLIFARRGPARHPFDPLVPILIWLAALVTLGAGAALGYRLLARARGGRNPGGAAPAGRPRVLGLVLLTGVLLAGAPGLVMDAVNSARHPNGGAYTNVALPDWRVDAARWLRAHSQPTDVLATNAHCQSRNKAGQCDSRTFWLSAYAERRVLIEGWLFAPRATTMAAFKNGQGLDEYQPFWDPDLLRANDAAITAPTAAGLDELRDRHHVRWLVVDRTAGRESPGLAALADREFDNGSVAIYRLRG